MTDLVRKDLKEDQEIDFNKSANDSSRSNDRFGRSRSDERGNAESSNRNSNSRFGAKTTNKKTSSKG